MTSPQHPFQTLNNSPPPLSSSVPLGAQPLANNPPGVNPQGPLADYEQLYGRQDYHIYVACKRIDKPNPYRVVRNIIFYDAATLALNLLFVVIFYASLPAVDGTFLIFQIIFGLLVILLTLLHIWGLEDAIKGKRLSQKLCCYNCFRVCYYILLVLNSLSNLLTVALIKGPLPGLVATWATFIILLSSFAMCFQPALYAIARYNTAVVPSFSPYGYGYPRYGYGYPQQQVLILAQAPPYGQAYNPYMPQPAQQPIPMSQINMYQPPPPMINQPPQIPGGASQYRPPLMENAAPQANSPPANAEFVPFKGKGASIGE